MSSRQSLYMSSRQSAATRDLMPLTTRSLTCVRDDEGVVRDDEGVVRDDEGVVRDDEEVVRDNKQSPFYVIPTERSDEGSLTLNNNANPTRQPTSKTPLQSRL
jgi:hypothetical protein